MDSTESIVHAYLSSLNFTNVKYEPDGNISPDFVVDNTTAVECRRINQHVDIGGRNEGIELASAALYRIIDKFAINSGPSINGLSWFITYTVSRPLPNPKQVRKGLVNLLAYLRLKRPEEHFEFELLPQFSVDIYPADNAHETALMVGGYSDHDAGGFVVSELIRNIQICIDEKTDKIANHSSRYGSWWLALVDRSNLGIDPEDIDSIAAHVSIPKIWNRVILLNPNEPLRGFDIVR